LLLLAIPSPLVAAGIQQGEMAGYLFGPAQKVPEDFNAGFSLYAAAWPLVATYPGHEFQTGLCGTWMFPQHDPDHKPKGEFYTDVEGGLGWWRDTRFPTTTPKFIMGGVGPDFSFIANGPRYGAGTWEEPRGLYAFFTPFFWTQATINHPEWAGMLLDSRPAGPNKAIQMETQYVPAILTKNAAGNNYARIAPTSFPVEPEGYSTILHRLTAYKKAALWDDVKRWFDGGAPTDGAIRPEASAVHTFGDGGGPVRVDSPISRAGLRGSESNFAREPRSVSRKALAEHEEFERRFNCLNSRY
jgi:hypothetical protein